MSELTYDTLNSDSLVRALTNVITDYLLADGRLSIQTAAYVLPDGPSKRPEELIRCTVDKAVRDVLNAAKVTVSRHRTEG